MARRWNRCSVALDALAQFIDLDTAGFRIRWTNRTADTLHLHRPSTGLSLELDIPSSPAIRRANR